MAQVNDWSLDNLPGISFRAQLNGVVEALQTSSSGATSPFPVVPGMLWFDNGVSPAALRMRNAANTAWIKIIDTADVAASRTALSAMAQPTFTVGLGQVAGVYAAPSTNFSAPAGGVWWGRFARRNTTTLGIISQSAGLYGGGTTILTLGAGEDCSGDFIRIA
jgi:hypothetical protein